MKRLFLLLILSTLPKLVSQTLSRVDDLWSRIQSEREKENLSGAIPLFQELLAADFDAGLPVPILIHSDGMAENYFDLELYDSIPGVVAKALHHINNMNHRAIDSLCAGLLIFEALSYRKTEQYNLSKETYFKAIELYEKWSIKGYNTTYAYKNVAQVFIRQQNFVEAERYLMRALQADIEKEFLLSIYNQLANINYWQNQYATAFHYYHISLDLEGRPSWEAERDLIGASLHLKTGQLKKAEVLCGAALEKFTMINDPENLMICKTIKAEILASQNRFPEAEKVFKEQEFEVKKEYERKSRDVAKFYIAWGDFYKKSGDTLMALEKYQAAIIQTFSEFNNRDIHSNPAIISAPLEFQAFAACSYKALLLSRNGQVNHRESATEAFDLAFAVSNNLRQTYGTDEAKLELAASCQHLRQEAVKNLWALATTSGRPDQAILERLFLLIEDTRANALKDVLKVQEALQLTGLPDTLLRTEASFRQQLPDLIEKERSAKDVQEKKSIHSKIVDIQQKYHFLLQKIRKEYPVFAQRFAPGNTAAEMQQIQLHLPAQACILSWFDTGTSYLCIAMSKKGYDGWEVPKDSMLSQQIRLFTGMIADKSALEQHRDAWFSASSDLYRQLIPERIAASFQQWIVIPDAALCFLPFDALLTNAYHGNFANAPYVLQEKTVRYVWAARLLLQPEITTGHPQILWMAPFVAQGARQLAQLPYAVREIPDHFNTARQHNELATADTFMQYCQAYRFIHLSTHAQAGEEPRLEFADRSLSLPELYALRIPADLVCLSACETSGGALAGGEGVLSLARGFAYAGARRLVAGWWSVNDRSTAAFFEQFYSFAKDVPVDVAVRMAKQQMLANEQEPDARKSPYHWAAFGLYGHAGLLHFKETSSWAGPGVLALVLIVFLLYLLFRQEAVLHTSSDFGYQGNL